MFAKDRLGTGDVSGLDPNLGREAGNIADAGVQVITDHLAAYAVLPERLLPNVGLKRVRGRRQANEVVLMF